MEYKCVICKYCLREVLEEWETEYGCIWCDVLYHKAKIDTGE